jgi:hypothetical protein
MRRSVLALLLAGLLVQTVAFPVTATPNTKVPSGDDIPTTTGHDLGDTVGVFFQSEVPHSDTGGRESYLVRGILAVVATLLIVGALLKYYTGSALRLTVRRAALFIAFLWAFLYSIQVYDVVFTSYSGEFWPPRNFAVGMLVTITVTVSVAILSLYRRFS